MKSKFPAACLVIAACLARDTTTSATFTRAKSRPIVMTRQLIFHLLKKFADMGPSAIRDFLWKEFKFRVHHSTVIYGLETHAIICAQDRIYKDQSDYAEELAARILFEDSSFASLVESYHNERQREEISLEEYALVTSEALGKQTAAIMAELDQYIEGVAERYEVSKELIKYIIHIQTAKK